MRVCIDLIDLWCRYLRERFGGEEVNVEHKKKENRSETGFVTTMADYLDVSGQTTSHYRESV